MIYVALAHYPVLNRKGEIITSAVTNLDIHDISRLAATYDLAGYFVITPLQEQQELVRELTAHWLNGSSPNSDRKTALSMVRIAASLQEACAGVLQETGTMPVVAATSAKKKAGYMRWNQFREFVSHETDCSDPAPLLLLFGTASGLADSIFQDDVIILEPIEHDRSYNHLSVRSAVAITLDRLLGKR